VVKVGIAILTLNAGDSFVKLLDSLAIQNSSIAETLIIDSGSTDNTLKLAGKYPCKVISIDKKNFNHGGTRQFAAECLKNFDIVVFLTQDVILYDERSIGNLVAAFNNPEVGAAYGRQLPHNGASLLAAHARIFNYPPQNQLKSYEDKKKLGIKTAFLSDSFAAYRVKNLQAAGGFPNNVIVSEDMYVGAKMLKQGYQIAYAADACVYHSHDYTLCEEFKRYFDIGVFQGREAWIGAEFGGAEGEGLRLVLNQLNYLWEHNGAYYIPKAILANAVKFMGYRLGFYEKYLSISVKKKMSGQSYFFK
jgi:rhamnosyltransferase